MGSMCKYCQVASLYLLFSLDICVYLSLRFDITICLSVVIYKLNEIIIFYYFPLSKLIPPFVFSFPCNSFILNSITILLFYNSIVLLYYYIL